MEIEKYIDSLFQTLIFMYLLFYYLHHKNTKESEGNSKGEKEEENVGGNRKGIFYW